MRRVIIGLCVAQWLALTAYGQASDYFQRRARTNVGFLTKSLTIQKRVRITETGIDIFPKDNTYHPEFRIYWNEIPSFIKLIEDKDFYTIQDFYGAKKANRFADPVGYSGISYVDFPTSLKGLRVAIDPGHFAGNLAEARAEGRIVNIRGTDLGQPADVNFFEAHLTYATALELKRLLTKAGAQVLVTRSYGASALGMTFAAWLTENAFADIHRSFDRGDIKKSLRDTLLLAVKDSTTTTHRYQLFQFFKFLDFRARAQKINAFHPNITFVLHYNIKENSRASGSGRYIRPTSSNYTMAFIPGAFKQDEFEKSDQKVDFLRLLLSPDLENSGRLADLVIRKHAEVLGVAPVPYDTLQAMKDVVVRTPYPGVFARNLYLTRAVRGPLVYGESLYQDNVAECRGLVLNNFTVLDESSGRTIQAPLRCADVARAYWLAVEAFLQENVRLHTEYFDVVQNKP